MKRRICVVVTARPSYSRVRTALLALKSRDDIELQVVLAASALLSRFGDIEPVMQQDGISPSARVYSIVEGENLVTSAKSTGLGLVELSSVFDRLKPDLVVTVADRFETIATAIAASYMNIPLAHLQGGEVTGNIDEKVRHSITKLADVHLVCTERSRDFVIRMGEFEESVFLTGCPSIDIAAEMLSRSDEAFDPFAKYGGVGDTPHLDGNYIVVMQHPVTTEHAQAHEQVIETLEAVRQLDMPALWFWPNVDAGSDSTSKAIREYRERGLCSNIHFFRNMQPVDFLRLIHDSRCLVGNSSVGVREASFLGIPTVNIGSRQDGRERAVNVRDVVNNRDAILAAIREQIEHGRYPADSRFGVGDAGPRIANVLASCPLSTAKRLAYV